MAESLRDLILSADDTDLKPLEVPEWKVTVYLGSFTLAEQKEFSEALDKAADEDLVVCALRLGLRDEHGAHIFTKKDVDALVKKNAKIGTRLFDAVMAHNKVRDDEDRVKN